MKTQSDCIEGMFDKLSEPNTIETIHINDMEFSVHFNFKKGTSGRTNCKPEDAIEPESNEYEIVRVCVYDDDNGSIWLSKSMIEHFYENIKEELEKIYNGGNYQ